MPRATEPSPTPGVAVLRELVGTTDIYLLDQLVKGRFRPGSRILDAGCGGGRNLPLFLRGGYEVHAIDRDPRMLMAARKLAMLWDGSRARFRVEAVEALALADGSCDAVVASALLHFARDLDHFRAQVGELWRVLAPGGFLFVRLASTIGIERELAGGEEEGAPGGRRYRLPDGSDRFLVDETLLAILEAELGARRLEPLKTTVVERLRAMTTWCLVKESGVGGEVEESGETEAVDAGEDGEEIGEAGELGEAREDVDPAPEAECGGTSRHV